MSISVCVGSYAQTPFNMSKIGVRVYCMEELCYSLKENAFLLDNDIMSEELLNWIRQECELEELARALQSLIRKQGSLSAFVNMILRYVGFYDSGQIRQVEQVLKKGAGLNVLEKHKARADYLVERKKYFTSLTEYNALLEEWEEEKEVQSEELKSQLLHNKGVVLAKLMLYQEAAKCFYSAYEIDTNIESLGAYLAAERMRLEEEEYIRVIADMPEAYEVSLTLEKVMEETKYKWKESEQEYDKEQLITMLQQEYRSCVSE